MSVKDPEGEIPEDLPESDDDGQENEEVNPAREVSDATVEGDDPDKSEDLPDLPA